MEKGTCHCDQRREEKRWQQVAWLCLGWQTCLFRRKCSTHFGTPSTSTHIKWLSGLFHHTLMFHICSSLCVHLFFHNREIAPCSLKECHERTITWATVLNESKAVARAIMVAPSEKVLISAREGSIRWVECVLGALFSGGVPTHINPSCSHAQFKQCIETCQTRWLFIEDKLVC